MRTQQPATERQLDALKMIRDREPTVPLVIPDNLSRGIAGRYIQYLREDCEEHPGLQQERRRLLHDMQQKYLDRTIFWEEEFQGEESILYGRVDALYPQDLSWVLVVYRTEIRGTVLVTATADITVFEPWHHVNKTA